MADDVLINKAATVERCIARAREEYDRNTETFTTDFTRQDAAVLNIQRACEAVLDMGQHLVRKHHLGVPQSARDVFEMLAPGGGSPSRSQTRSNAWWLFGTSLCMTTKACSYRF